MFRALRQHYPEYLMEALALGLFMVSACGFGILLWHPAAAGAASLPDGVLRRAAMGIAMGITAVALIYSPWGKRSGAHMNPAVTVAFWSLGKVQGWDAIFYAGSQVAGGLLGVLTARALFGAALADPAVHYVVTRPHAGGAGIAFAAEVAIAFLMMATVLAVSNSGSPGLTGVFAGVLVACYITFEAPLSGMSLNPARTLASAIPAMDFTALWVYLTAPFIGMLLASASYRAARSAARVRCAKLLHPSHVRCIFCQTASPHA